MYQVSPVITRVSHLGHKGMNMNYGGLHKMPERLRVAATPELDKYQDFNKLEFTPNSFAPISEELVWPWPVHV
jgi:hypothetical protein